MTATPAIVSDNKVRATHEIIEATLDAVSDGMLVLDPQLRVTAWNVRFLDLYPHLRESCMVGESAQALYLSDGGVRRDKGLISDAVDWAETRIRNILSGLPSIKDEAPNGDTIQILPRTLPDGSVVLVHRPVDRVSAEQQRELRASDYLHDTLENVDHGIASFDAQHRLTLWNRRYVELTDTPPSMVVAGLPLLDIIRNLAATGNLGKGDPETLARRYYEACTTDLPRIMERKTADDRTVEVRASKGLDGGLIICVIDITDRIAQAEALKESEERYALAAAGANDGLWDWDLKKNSIYLSDRWKKMLGYEPNEIGSSPDELFSRIHPFDVQEVTARLEAHLNTDQSQFECEFRALHQDGTYRWMLIRGVAVRDEAGEPLRIAGSQSDITVRKRAEEQMLHDALHDALTGLANRGLFHERIDQALNRLKRGAGRPFAVLYIDLDRFKVVNESMGHGRGDELLIAVARRFEGLLDDVDTVARLGGDEFGMLLESVDDQESAEAFGRRLQEALKEPFVLNGKPYITTASIGIAMGDSHYDRADSLLRDADLAMYHAKAAGRADVGHFRPFMHRKAVQTLDMERDLRQALDREELRLYYQPFIDLGTGRATGLEALIRWEHQDRGVLSPHDFVPLAEETGLIVPIGEWVLKTGVGQLAEWNRRRAPEEALSLAVNFSVRQLDSLEITEGILGWLDEIEFDPSLLKIEITESILMDNPQRSAQLLNRFKQSKVKVALDDFGTGYSSLSYLRTFPIDTLKVDKSFVADITENKDNYEIVRTIVGLARNLDIDVVAEGIENEAQADHLRALGVHIGQGYLYSRPLGRDDMEAVLASGKI
ncbi:MAG: EAL domain-containing protein [Alphaproteobacteria bacterium]|nr:EAL domain-containing protein [Alphaproteobacteria bacterium]